MHVEFVAFMSLISEGVSAGVFSLADYQNARQFIYCPSGNQTLLCCRS